MFMCLCSVAKKRECGKDTHTQSMGMYGCYTTLITSSQKYSKNKTHSHGNHFNAASIPQSKRRSGREINTLIYYLVFKIRVGWQREGERERGTIWKWDNGINGKDSKSDRDDITHIFKVYLFYLAILIICLNSKLNKMRIPCRWESKKSKPKKSWAISRSVFFCFFFFFFSFFAS